MTAVPRALNAPVSPSEPVARPDTPPPWSPAALRPLVGRVVASCALRLVRLADRIDPQEPPTTRNRAVEESKARHPAFGGPVPAAVVVPFPSHLVRGTGHGASEGDPDL